jgi:hypothetical protein
MTGDAGTQDPMLLAVAEIKDRLVKPQMEDLAGPGGAKVEEAWSDALLEAMERLWEGWSIALSQAVTKDAVAAFRVVDAHLTDMLHMMSWMPGRVTPPAGMWRPGDRVLATVPVEIVADSIQLVIGWAPDPEGRGTWGWTNAATLDTGAFEVLIGAQTASQIHPRNEGPVEVGGVGGSAQAYKTHVAIQLLDPQTGRAQFTMTNVAAVVDTRFDQDLFGLRAILHRGYGYVIRPRARVITLFVESPEDGPIAPTVGELQQAG